MKDQQYFCYDNFSPNRRASDEEIKEVKTSIKSCIISCKGGMPINNLRGEYKQLTDEEIPYLKLGYKSLFHFLRDIPEIKSTRNDAGEHVLVVHPDNKTEHLHNLIKKQKEAKSFLKRKNTSNDDHLFCEKKLKTFPNYKAYYGWRVNADNDKTPPVNERRDSPKIQTQYYLDDEMTACTHPTVARSQLIGDDYFLQLCIKYLNVPLKRRNQTSAITCGTVQSGLTIKKALNRLDKIKIMSNKLLINVGTVDIYNRHTDKEMINDYINLLNKLEKKYGYSSNQITVCTLPPLGNVSVFGDQQKYMYHISFNNWLREYAENNNYNLLDLHEEFIDSNMIIKYQYFQQDARMVSGTNHPHVLWNYWGRQKVMKLLYNL